LADTAEVPGGIGWQVYQPEIDPMMYRLGSGWKDADPEKNVSLVFATCPECWGSGSRFLLSRTWPTEHFRRPDNRRIRNLPAQVVALRRDTAPLLAISPSIPEHVKPYADILSRRTRNNQTEIGAVRMFVTPGPDSLVEIPSERPSAKLFISKGQVPAGRQIVDVESAPIGANGSIFRIREWANIRPPLSGLPIGKLDVSAPALLYPGVTEADRPTADRALAQLLPSTRVSLDKVGLYWEIYGARITDTLSVSLEVFRIEPPAPPPEEPGFWTTLARRIGVAEAPETVKPTDITLHWRDLPTSTSCARTTAQVRCRWMTLELKSLKPGDYKFQVRVARDSVAAESSRLFRIDPTN
jgi:hypothetical protein